MAEPPPPPGQHKEQPKDEVGTRKGFKRYKWEFKDSNKEFWLGGHAAVKILSVVCMLISLSLLEKVPTNPILILLLSMEVSIFIFFILLYTTALQRYMPFIFWPITHPVREIAQDFKTDLHFQSAAIGALQEDLFNDLFSSVFLIGGMYFALSGRRVLKAPYITAMVFMGLATLFNLIDMCLQKPHLTMEKIQQPPPEAQDGPAKPEQAPPATNPS